MFYIALFLCEEKNWVHKINQILMEYPIRGKLTIESHINLLAHYIERWHKLTLIWSLWLLFNLVANIWAKNSSTTLHQWEEGDGASVNIRQAILKDKTVRARQIRNKCVRSAALMVMCGFHFAAKKSLPLSRTYCLRKFHLSEDAAIFGRQNVHGNFSAATAKIFSRQSCGMAPW